MHSNECMVEVRGSKVLYVVWVGGLEGFWDRWSHDIGGASHHYDDLRGFLRPT